MKTLKELVTEYKEALAEVSEATRLANELNLLLRPLRDTMELEDLIHTVEYEAYDISTYVEAFALQKRYTIASKAIAAYGFDKFYDAVDEAE